MDFLKTTHKNKIILTINKSKIDDDIVDNILKATKNHQTIGLDMKNVITINSKKFINLLLTNKFKLFNLQSEILMYISIILKEGSLKSYINKNDFIENKRELIKRRFLVA